jgi:hypothetical protein
VKDIADSSWWFCSSKNGNTRMTGRHLLRKNCSSYQSKSSYPDLVFILLFHVSVLVQKGMQMEILEVFFLKHSTKVK